MRQQLQCPWKCLAQVDVERCIRKEGDCEGEERFHGTGVDENLHPDPCCHLQRPKEEPFRVPKDQKPALHTALLALRQRAQATPQQRDLLTDLPPYTHQTQTPKVVQSPGFVQIRQLQIRPIALLPVSKHIHSLNKRLSSFKQF